MDETQLLFSASFNTSQTVCLCSVLGYQRLFLHRFAPQLNRNNFATECWMQVLITFTFNSFHRSGAFIGATV